MKIPNCKKWVKIQRKEAQKIRSQDVDEKIEGIRAIAKLSRYTARGFKRGGALHEAYGQEEGAKRAYGKSSTQYAQSAEAYEMAGDYVHAIRMYELAGQKDRADALRNETAKRRDSVLDNLGFTTCLIFLFLGILFFSFEFTGFAIIENLERSSGIMGALLFVFGIFGFLLFSRKR